MNKFFSFLYYIMYLIKGVWNNKKKMTNAVSHFWLFSRESYVRFLGQMSYCSRHVCLLAFHSSVFFTNISGLLLISFGNSTWLPGQLCFLICWNFKYFHHRNHMCDRIIMWQELSLKDPLQSFCCWSNSKMASTARQN